MAAYAALVSLSNTIHRLLNHNRLSISVEENEQLVSLIEYVNSFQAFLENFPDKYNSLEGRMRKLAREAEDIIEYFILEQVSWWPNFKVEEFILKLKQVTDNIDMLADRIKELYDNSGSGSEEDESCDVSSSSTDDPPISKDGMVGFVIDRLCGEPSKLQVIPICGMAGTGKTTLARNAYDDPSIIDHFVIRVWVTISQYSTVQRTLSSLLECLELRQGDEERVYQILRHKRYLVVIDNIWSCKAWDAVKKLFPDESNGSRIMITTRLCEVASYPDPSSKLFQMGLWSEDQSWDFLKKKVFGDENCVSKLEDIGKEIARRCKGWPLAVTVIADALYTITRSDRSWEEISEDFLKDFESENIMSSSDDESRCHPSRKHELHLREVIQEISLVANEVKEIEDISSKDVADADSCDALSSSSTSPLIHSGEHMFGFEEHVMDLKCRLYGESSKLQVIPICGMGGIGKTTLARNVYDDPLTVEYFVIRVWVTVSQDFSAERIFSSIMESLMEYNKDVRGQSDDEIVYKILVGRRYLVVMDDMWSSEAWDAVRRVFPDNGNRSRVLLTTRLSDVASYPDSSSKLHEMSLLSAYQSWNLLKQKVFADEDCPSELENIGIEIARSCKGLPLAIVVVAGLLSPATKNPTSWVEIANNVKSMENAEHKQIEAILSLSYTQLPQYLRSCFLYMGSFPEDHEIRVEELVRLWVAEGFVESSNNSHSFEEVAEEILEELVKRNLVFATRWKWDGRIKSCSLHDLIRDLCIRISHRSNFFLNLTGKNIGMESFLEIRNQRRLSVEFSKLDFFSSLQSSAIRSIKSSRKHPGRMDFLESVRLLRVLDTQVYSRYLPTLVHRDKLFHLRYLAVTSYEDVPTSLSMLQNLETLVIRTEMIMRCAHIWLSWCMSQLRHVYFGGKILFVYPEESTCPLENLQTLAYVSYQSCTEKILKLLPNLKELKIDCCDDDAVCLNDLVHLHRLEDLEVFAGGSVREQPNYIKITFPRSLRKLTLKWLKLPWNNIFVVGSLPNLQVLKLKSCTCIGGTWETSEGAFPALEILVISCSWLENWMTESSHFPKLKSLLLDNCTNLNGIPSDIGDISTLEVISGKGRAKKSLVESVAQIREEQEDFGNTLEVSIRFQFFDDDDDDDDPNSRRPEDVIEFVSN